MIKYIYEIPKFLLFGLYSFTLFCGSALDLRNRDMVFLRFSGGDIFPKTICNEAT